MTFRKHAPPPGARPGTLAIPAGSPAPEIHAVRYSESGAQAEPVADVESLAALRADAARAGEKLWIDVHGLGDERVLRRIAAIFEIDPLALEDAVNVPQRAASKLYARHHVLIARMPVLGAEGAIEVPQVCLMIGDGHLLSFQERHFAFFQPVRERLREGVGPIRQLGPDYLAYALIDTLVDRYYPIAQALSEEIEELEDEIVENPRPDALTGIHRVRRRLIVIRRVGMPQREAIATLVREPSKWVSDAVRPFLRDTLEHIAQIVELVESSRELCVGLTEIHLSNMSQRTNEVMKVLTILSSIFIPATFLAGLFGMNFDHIPGLHRPGAFVLLIAAMGVIALVMLLFFQRRGWIGRSRGSR